MSTAIADAISRANDSTDCKMQSFLPIPLPFLIWRDSHAILYRRFAFDSALDKTAETSALLTCKTQVNTIILRKILEKIKNFFRNTDGGSIMYNILVAINNFDSPLAIRTMEEAVSIVRGQREECVITLLHIQGSDTTAGRLSVPLPLQAQTNSMYSSSLPMTSITPSDSNSIPDEYANLGTEIVEKYEVLDQAGGWLKEKGIRYETVSKSGDPASEICKYAEDYDIDMIVMGRQDKGAIAKIFIGSVSKKVVESSPVSVFVVK